MLPFVQSYFTIHFIHVEVRVRTNIVLNNCDICPQSLSKKYSDKSLVISVFFLSYLFQYILLRNNTLRQDISVHKMHRAQLICFYVAQNSDLRSQSGSLGDFLGIFRNDVNGRVVTIAEIQTIKYIG